ncbi:MAG: UPF0489 family protein, partial [Nitrospirae bacterium]|nr:UPF0489 family protein [Nitrospirota bacterium]
MRNAAQVLGKEPVKDVILIENHSEALLHWLKKGYRNITVVHVDAHDDFEFVPEDKIKKIKELVKDQKFTEIEGLMDAGDRSLFTLSNYLYPAAKLGVVKEIYWIMPFRLFEFSDAERRVKDYLKTMTSVYSIEDIEGMKMKGGCLSGKLFKTKVNICSPMTLPPIQEPVIFDIDTDFFPPFSAERGYSMLRGVKEFFDDMNKRQLKIAAADIAFSEAGNFLKPGHRYVAEQIAEALKNPQILHSTVPPELWAVRDNANGMFLRGEWKELIEFLKEPLKKYPEEPSLIIFRASAQVYTGKYREALEGFTGLCRRYERLCYGFVYAGRELKHQERYEASEMFFKKALELKPQWSDAMFEYADMFYRKGDYE